MPIVKKREKKSRPTRIRPESADREQARTLRGLREAQKPRKASGDWFTRNVIGKAVQTAGGLASVARHTPGGLYQLGKASTYDLARGNTKPIRRIGRGQVSFYGDLFRHPGRAYHNHPEDLLLAALAVPTGGAGAARGLLRGARTVKGTRTALRHKGDSMLDAGVVALKSGVPLDQAAKMVGVSEKDLVAYRGTTGGRLTESRYGANRNITTKSGKRSRRKELTSALAEGRKLAAKRPKTRILSHKSRDMDEEQALSRPRGKEMVESARVGRTHKVEVPLSRSPVTALAQLTGDRLRGRGTRNFHKVQRNILREKDILSRLDERSAPGFLESLGEIRTGRTANPLKQPIRETNALIRGLRLFRPGYILPNLMGANTANLIHGALTPGRIAQQKRLRSNPRFRGPAHNLMGGGISQAALETSGAGPIATFMRGVGESAGKVTDRAARERSLIREGHRQGFISDEDVMSLINNPRFRRDLIQVVRRAEPEAIKFSRTPGGGPISKLDRALAENIFLYRWLTGSTQYAGRMLTEHPVAAASLDALGKDAPDISDILERYPAFLANYLPIGRRGKLPLVSNEQAFTLWGTPEEVGRNLAEGIHRPAALIEPLNPVQHFGAVAAMGYDPFRDWELKDQNLRKNLLFALNTELRSSPYANFFPANVGKFGQSGNRGYYGLERGRFYDTPEARARRLFPRSKLDILLTFLLGGVVPSPLNPDVASKLADEG